VTGRTRKRAPRAAADPVVSRLQRFFGEHEVWRAAADLLDARASSRVTFSHRPGEEWRLQRRRGHTVLEPGRAADPDLAFHFTPGAIERVTSVDGGLADFAIELFSAALDDDPTRGLRIEILASFPRLVRRGYVRLLWAGGAALIAFGARHGIHTVGDLRSLISGLAPSAHGARERRPAKAKRKPRT